MFHHHQQQEEEEEESKGEEEGETSDRMAVANILGFMLSPHPAAAGGICGGSRSNGSEIRRRGGG